ncbi:MAG: 50S ribosomal protein L28, partial [Pseudorhodobacter sp.]|nr:50S ribosomal protein L28 [Frankiaceae bacterium]
HRRTRRRWNPNIQTVRAMVGKAGRTPKKLNVCTSCIKAGKVVRAV